MMPEATHCIECGGALPAGLPKGLCPHCALKDVLELATENVPPPEIQEASLPRRVGDYELLEGIARGGMGVVYKARQLSLDRIVAVKMLLSGSQASADLVRRFRGEGVAAGSLQHPNIVAVHEVGLHQGQPFIVMDYVDGPTLSKLIKEGPLPIKRAARYLKTIAEAIHYAHGQKILHRDLKPSNVLVDSKDQARVTDFGLAKGFGDSPLPDRATTILHGERTEEGAVLGSPCYMPPEQAAGQRASIGSWSDVYSLGAMLYHLLTGRPPFSAQSVAETLTQVLQREPVSPRLLNGSVPRDLETICLKCLEKDPARRYPTAQELADDLGRWLRLEPIHARPAGPVLRAMRWTRRNPAGAALIACLLLALGASLVALRFIGQLREREQEAVQTLDLRVRTEMNELWSRSDVTNRLFSSEEVAALAGRFKPRAPGLTNRFRLALSATQDPVERAKEYESLLDRLEKEMEKELGAPVRIDVMLVKGSRLVDDALVGAKADFARAGALSIWRAHQLNPGIVLLAQENAPADAVLFTLPRSGITNLAGLRGRSLALADANSTLSAGAKALLVEAGLRGRDVRYEHLNSHNSSPTTPPVPNGHLKAIAAVTSGLSDAGVGRTKYVNELGEEGKDWIALAHFENLRDLWAAAAGVPSQVTEAFARVLPRITANQITLPTSASGFLPITPATLQQLERVSRAVDVFDGKTQKEEK